MPAYAHSLENQPPEKWETMAEHEERVAKYCRRFLKRIAPDLESWGDSLGKWHDLGKYSDEFQKYIVAANVELEDGHRAEVKGRVDHSTAAAQLAIKQFQTKGMLLAYCFAGHHAGLPNWDDGHSHSGLKQRLEKEIPDWEINAPESLAKTTFPGMPQLSMPKPENHEHAAFRVSFWIRFIFSALVDSDFLATEAFMSPQRGEQRPESVANLTQLRDILDKHLASMECNSSDTIVNSVRRSIGMECLEKSSLPPGFFSLSVPTGGGKTLASLRFALNHAISNQLDRVILAVPFTSIIEQNAQVYRELFAELGPEIVLEHHSNLDPETETTTNRLQAENWDAPLVVSTNVQFFESLFACKTSRCRKLHRIANSVIVLDEAQTLPIELLKPTLLALRELVDSFGCSIVLCSATQPALNWREDFAIGIRNIRPIIENAHSLHDSLLRTKVEVAGVLDNESLAAQLNEHEQILCIVNTRNHAAELFELLSGDEDHDCFHLSTRMCAAHRIKKLDEIRARLKSGMTCRVVSTQLIEAGVDVDFPIVYRAACGLDSLAQAAGRCNREGLRETGRVIFFDAETPPPVGFLRQSSDSAKELLDKFSNDLISPAAIEAYFELHYWKKTEAWDFYKVLEPIGNQPSKLQFNFRQVAERYRFIRDESETLLVGYDDEGKSLLCELEKPKEHIHRSTWRRLQRFAVQVRQHELFMLKNAGAIELLHERYVLTQPHLYEDGLGLKLSQVDGVLPIEDCIL